MSLFTAAYSEQQVTSTFITVCTMQMTADWMVVVVGEGGSHKPSWRVSWLWGCQTEGRSSRHLACFPEPFISCLEPTTLPMGLFSKQQDMPATQYVPESESHTKLALQSLLMRSSDNTQSLYEGGWLLNCREVHIHQIQFNPEESIQKKL